MKKKILGIFSKEPLIWFHYILLTGIVLLGLYIYYPDLLIFQKFIKTIIVAFIPLYLLISISDQLIHKILGVD